MGPKKDPIRPFERYISVRYSSRDNWLRWSDPHFYLTVCCVRERGSETRVVRQIEVGSMEEIPLHQVHPLVP